VTIAQSVFDFLLGGPKVGGEQEERLNRWRALPAADLALPHAQARYVAIHAVTSGPDRRRDRLMAIAAVAVRRRVLDFADCFERVLRQEKVSGGANILLHGIGGEHQLAGVDPRTSMLEFLEYLGKAPLVALGHDELDRLMIERGVHSLLGYPFDQPWIRLAPLVSMFLPGAAAIPIDRWPEHFGLVANGGDHALGQALATAQLLQMTLVAAERAGAANAAQLLARQRPSR
jgi:DNA polymerase-3 subunit epsilon